MSGLNNPGLSQGSSWTHPLPSLGHLTVPRVCWTPVQNNVCIPVHIDVGFACISWPWMWNHSHGQGAPGTCFLNSLLDYLVLKSLTVSRFHLWYIVFFKVFKKGTLHERYVWKMSPLHYNIEFCSGLANTCFLFPNVAIFNQMVINVTGKNLTYLHLVFTVVERTCRWILNPSVYCQVNLQ